MKERLFWIGSIILLILYFTKCNQKKCPVIKEISYDTTIIKLPGKDSIAWKTPKVKTVFRDRPDTPISDYAINDDPPAENDTAKIYDDWMTTRYYEDTTKLEYADIITRDSLNKNRIFRHGVTALNWNLPVVTKTVTYTQPKKSEIYGGLKFGYNNIGADLMFKDTLNRIWEANVIYIGKFYYSVGRKWQIK